MPAIEINYNKIRLINQIFCVIPIIRGPQRSGIGVAKHNIRVKAAALGYGMTLMNEKELRKAKTYNYIKGKSPCAGLEKRKKSRVR
jgi:hypothetical protein